MSLLAFTPHIRRQALSLLFPRARCRSTSALTLGAPSSLVRPLPSTRPPPSTLPNPDDFRLYPDFLTEEEQSVLLTLALWKLDRVDSSRKRRRRRRSSESESSRSPTPPSSASSGPIQAIFESDPSAYGFEEGHFDSVIAQYRETLLTTFPPPPTIHPAIPYPPILTRLFALLPGSPSPTSQETGADETFLPPEGTTTHALHLAPNGYILPHVDNLEASGSVILGLSLGASRVMRLERESEGSEEKDKEGWEVLLKSGSVYVQRDSVRYDYAHSILSYDDPASEWDGDRLECGHRLSLMIRDAPPSTPLS